MTPTSRSRASEPPSLVDIKARSITPTTSHQIGRDMRIWATLPDGRDVALVRDEDWDFNWQITYDFEGR